IPARGRTKRHAETRRGGAVCTARSVIVAQLPDGLIPVLYLTLWNRDSYHMPTDQECLIRKTRLECAARTKLDGCRPILASSPDVWRFVQPLVRFAEYARGTFSHPTPVGVGVHPGSDQHGRVFDPRVGSGRSARRTG